MGGSGMGSGGRGRQSLRDACIIQDAGRSADFEFSFFLTAKKMPVPPSHHPPLPLLHPSVLLE